MVPVPALVCHAAAAAAPGRLVPLAMTAVARVAGGGRVGCAAVWRPDDLLDHCAAALELLPGLVVEGWSSSRRHTWGVVKLGRFGQSAAGQRPLSCPG